MSKVVPLLLISSAIVVAACAHKQQPVPPAPPPPPPAPIEQPQTVPPAEPVSTVPPGSQAALIQAAGSDTIHFAFDSYALDDEARSILTKQAAWLNSNPNVNARIEGNADERGTREYNLALGERRAVAGKNFLVAQGVPQSRLSTISYGKERPLVEGSNEAAWAANRRDQTVVVSGGN